MDSLSRELIQQILQSEANTDSVEIGTPSKGGVLKVYFNADDPAKAKARIDAAIHMRAYAAQALAGGAQA